MNSLQKYGIDVFYHSTPIHYLPFIARDKKLRSKQSLLKSGFEASHFRRTSNNQDLIRGFGDCIHSTVNEWPPILCAKLAKGFPHVRLAIPTSLLSKNFDLCRFNIAKGRYLKSGSSSLPENVRNGKYYDDLELPVARLFGEQFSMLKEAEKDPTVIEVLEKGVLHLSDAVECQVFSQSDYDFAVHILRITDSNLKVVKIGNNGRYIENNKFASDIEVFVERALKDPSWRGNGLDYDKL